MIPRGAAEVLMENEQEKQMKIVLEIIFGG
jgi:hypothetical protein